MTPDRDRFVEGLAFRWFLSLKGRKPGEMGSCLCGHFDQCTHYQYYDEVRGLIKKWDQMSPRRRAPWTQPEPLEYFPEFAKSASLSDEDFIVPCGRCDRLQPLLDAANHQIKVQDEQIRAGAEERAAMAKRLQERKT